MNSYSLQELMAVAGAREILNHQVVLVGIGLPQASALLAKFTHAPQATLLLEMGLIDAIPVDTPRGLADPRAWHKATCYTSVIDIMGMNLHRGLVDVGLIGALEIDALGNINSTILKNEKGKVKRFGGSGGLNDIASLAQRTLIIMPHQKRKFNKMLTYITAPGHVKDSIREEVGLRGGGPYKVITDKAILEFDKVQGQFVVSSIHPSATIKGVIEAIQFQIRTPDHIPLTPEPNPDELKILREIIDPHQIILREPRE